MYKILKLPLSLFEVFTSEKSFQGNPIIGSPLLNRLGLHVVRLVVSHGVMRFRMLLLSLLISADDRKSYFSQGYLVKENFLSDEEFRALEEQAQNFDGEIREARQGDTLTHRAVLSPDVLEDYPAIEKALFSKKLMNLLKFTGGHLRAPLYYLEQVKNKYCTGSNDPQKYFHHDTYHPSMKCWLFLDDVESDMGPFTYIPQSHKLDWKRIKWEYKMSLTASEHLNGLHARGSTRYTEEDLRELGFGEPVSFSVKKNTLVIANVFGIHKRGDSSQKSTRLALWGDSRTNPFIPLPGIGGQYANSIQYYFLNQFRKRVDERARAQGHRSPWQIIQSKKNNV